MVCSPHVLASESGSTTNGAQTLASIARGEEPRVGPRISTKPIKDWGKSISHHLRPSLAISSTPQDTRIRGRQMKKIVHPMRKCRWHGLAADVAPKNDDPHMA